MIHPAFRLRGIFGSALAQLEEYERSLFAAGKFEAYKQDILRGIGTPAGDAESVIRRLTVPHHIDFWRLPRVAGEYLRYGYALDGYSKEVLVDRGYVTRDANERELSFALRKNHGQLRGYILCVLTKPWVQEEI